MIYTIGYSTRSLPEFWGELEKRRITHLIDVRSSPWSRNAPFYAPQIEKWAPKAGIFYRQCGEILGGMSNTPVDDPAYIGSLEKIIEASIREPVAIMCAEGNPEHCHRTWDIAASLLIHWGIIATSICRDGSTEDATTSLRRVKSSNFAAPIRRNLSDILGVELL